MVKELVVVAAIARLDISPGLEVVATRATADHVRGRTYVPGVPWLNKR